MQTKMKYNAFYVSQSTNCDRINQEYTIRSNWPVSKCLQQRRSSFLCDWYGYSKTDKKERTSQKLVFGLS